MRRYLMLACLLSVAGFAPAPFPKTPRARGDSDAADLAALQGTWRIRQLTYDGKDFDRTGWRVVVAGSRLKHVPPDKDEILQYVITLNARARPKEIDLTIELPNNRKMILRGTYAFRGSELLLCTTGAFNAPQRPTSCGPGPSWMFETLERVSDGQ